MSQGSLYLKYKVMKNLEETKQGKTSKKLHHIIAACEFVKTLGIFHWLNSLMANSVNFLSIAKENKGYSEWLSFWTVNVKNACWI